MYKPVPSVRHARGRGLRSGCGEQRGGEGREGRSREGKNKIRNKDSERQTIGMDEGDGTLGY